MSLLSKLFGIISEGAKSEGPVYSTEKIMSGQPEKVVAKEDHRDFEGDIPPLQGNYAKAIFLYANNRPSPVKEAEGYPRYLLYECGIRNPLEYHRTLINEGYFEPTALKEGLGLLKIAELKDLLSENGLATTGKKDSLIERIIDELEEEKIYKYCPKDMYSISKKGKEFLEEYKDYVEIHRHKNWGIDWCEFDANKKAGMSFFDTVWGILNKRILVSKSFGRNEYVCMYQLLEEEGKKKRAIEILLKIIYIDFSGYELLEYVRLYKSGIYTKEDLQESFSSTITIAPGIINAVPKYLEEYDDEIIEKLFQWQLPIQICSKKLFYEIIHSLFDGTYIQENTEEKIRESYNRAINSLI